MTSRKKSLAQRRRETRSALWKLLFPGAGGSLLGFLLLLGGLSHGNIIAVDWLWLLWAAGVLIFLMLCVVYVARRAVWPCLFRAVFLAVFMLTVGLACLLAAMEALNFDDSLLLAMSALTFFMVCVHLVHTKRTVPYWQLTFAQNTSKKVDLQNGVFSVATEWSSFPGDVHSKSQRSLVVYGLGPIGAGLGLMLSKGLGGTPWIHAVFGALAFSLFGIAAFSDSEAYFALKLLELERQIGKPIVMDGYQTEEHVTGDAAHE